MRSFAAPLSRSDHDFDFGLHAANPANVDHVAVDPDWALLELPFEGAVRGKADSLTKHAGLKVLWTGFTSLTEIDVPEEHRPQTDDADSGPVTDRRRAPDDHWHDLDISELTVELAGNEERDGDKRNAE
ncbi:hypothetical protein HDU87_006399 [Geranomyces variabilis]|uniref:Uncharacterized protein n=1 Tax=Geranomyces variabilis TaxID=109894 RepID=A0AAD5XL29_9FUNG|nr:hypothetical protein HDU87_006399 [Geranomyces variabilis]